LCILNNYNDYSDKLFKLKNKNSKDEIEQYNIKGNIIDISFLSNKKREKVTTVIEYKFKNNFNIGIGNTRLVID
jgi:hypothetical protein